MNTRIADLPIRIFGALLLLAATDPARWPHYLSPQWFFGVVAVCAGFWAAGPTVERPEMRSYRLKHQALRYRNTLLAAAAALVAAASQTPPVWLMAGEVALLLTYLVLVDVGAAPARTGQVQLNQAGYAYAASALVLLAALAPVTGGGWGRFVAAVCVIGTLGLLLGTLRLRDPAAHPRDEPRRNTATHV